MSDIPHQAVVGGVVHIVQSYGNLYGAKARAEVARVVGATLDEIMSQLATIALKLRYGQSLEVGGRIYLV
jgi:hypothetical protein